MEFISNPLASELLISLFSSFASFAPSRLNHSDATGNDITPTETKSDLIGTQEFLTCAGRFYSCSRGLNRHIFLLLMLF